MASDICEALRTRLLANASIVSLVSSRIRPWKRSQADILPAITYRVENEEPTYTTDEGDEGLFAASVEFHAWATTHLGAWNLAKLIRTQLSGATFTDSPIDVQGSFLRTFTDVPDEEEEGQDQATFHYVAVFEFWYREDA